MFEWIVIILLVCLVLQVGGILRKYKNLENKYPTEEDLNKNRLKQTEYLNNIRSEVNAIHHRVNLIIENDKTLLIERDVKDIRRKSMEIERYLHNIHNSVSGLIENKEIVEEINMLQVNLNSILLELRKIQINTEKPGKVF